MGLFVQGGQLRDILGLQPVLKGVSYGTVFSD